MTTIRQDGREVVTVLPVTHSAPADDTLAVEIPAATKHRLGLDDARSWIVLTEANRFVWPGPDLRPVPGDDEGSVAYGQLPSALYDLVRTKWLAAFDRDGQPPNPINPGDDGLGATTAPIEEVA